MSSKNQHSKKSNPAIILAYGNHVTGLGMLRGLGREGVKTYLIDKEKFNLGKYSKYCDEFVKVKEEIIANEEKFIEFLRSFKEENDLERPVLFPTNDYYVYLLSKNKAVLEKDFYVGVPDWEITKKCYNKVLTYQFAEEIGLSIPKSFFMRDGISLEEIDREIDYPFIIKPGVMIEFLRKTGKKAFKVNDFEELERKYEEASSAVDPKDLIIQEIIPGGPERLISYGSLFWNGKEIAGLVKKSIRQLPMDFGVSTCLKNIEYEEMKEKSKDILRYLDYEGMSEVEFKKDPRDEKLKFFEINPRPWKWHGLLLSNGRNLPYLYYRSLIGENFDQNFRNSDEIKWIDTYPDLLISAKEILRRNMSVRNYVSSIKGEKTFSVYNSNDVFPFIMETILLPYFYLK